MGSIAHQIQKENYSDRIKESIDRAKNTSINNIIITGDFNLNIFDTSARTKIYEISMQFGLQQLIKDTTYFTEHSSFHKLMILNLVG